MKQREVNFYSYSYEDLEMKQTEVNLVLDYIHMSVLRCEAKYNPQSIHLKQTLQESILMFHIITNY